MDYNLNDVFRANSIGDTTRSLDFITSEVIPQVTGITGITSSLLQLQKLNSICFFSFRFSGTSVVVNAGAIVEPPLQPLQQNISFPLLSSTITLSNLTAGNAVFNQNVNFNLSGNLVIPNAITTDTLIISGWYWIKGQ